MQLFGETDGLARAKRARLMWWRTKVVLLRILLMTAAETMKTGFVSDK